MKHTLFLELIRKPSRPPIGTLTLVIDTLDECGSTQSCRDILNALTSAAAHISWLKVIITSRPKVDIQRFFDGPTQLPYLQYNLTADKDATSDLRVFAEKRFSEVAEIRCLESRWPEPLLFDKVISRAAGLFIFIKTLASALEDCYDHTELLRVTLQDSAEPGLTSLHNLYSSIVGARKVHSNAEFRQVIGILLVMGPYCPLCNKTIAELAGVRDDLVKQWIDELSSLLYRDEGANGGIRVRHLSISEFFFDYESDYQVNLQDTNVNLSITCLEKMLEQLRFNICKLEDSQLANAEVKDLSTRIKDNIPDALQYCSLHWSNHLCSTPDTGDWCMWESLRKFFEGPCVLYWIEVLSLMGMLGIGVPSLRRVTSTLVKVSTAPGCSHRHSNVILTEYRVAI